MSKKVTIVIPAYTVSRDLAESIESALLQTHSNMEIIVIGSISNDDGAGDLLKKQKGFC